MSQDYVCLLDIAIVFSNKPFRQWTGHNGSSNVDDLHVRCGLMHVGDDCLREHKQDHVHSTVFLKLK